MNKVVARGAVVNYGAFMCSKLVTFASTVVLARLLVPKEFGVVGYALLVLGLLYVLKNFGMGTALIYGQDLDDDRASSLLMVAVVGAIAVARGRQGYASLSKAEKAVARMAAPPPGKLLPAKNESGVFSHEIHAHEAEAAVAPKREENPS